MSAIANLLLMFVNSNFCQATHFRSFIDNGLPLLTGGFTILTIAFMLLCNEFRSVNKGLLLVIKMQPLAICGLTMLYNGLAFL